jgi:uncharacterized lipoprotein YajG
MKKVKLLPLLVISLFALSLTGCDSPPWESGMALVVKVDTPQEGTTITASPVTVTGRVIGTQSKSAKMVRINDIEAPINEGQFSANLTLKEGKNAIMVSCSAAGANLSETVNVTYAPSK